MLACAPRLDSKLTKSSIIDGVAWQLRTLAPRDADILYAVNIFTHTLD